MDALFLPLLVALALGLGPAAASADALGGDSSEDRAFRVRIAGNAPLQGVLGGALTIPCHVHYLRPPPGRRAVLGSPRVKWTFLSGGREAEVLVARGLRVKVSDAYRFRVALPAYPASLTDVSLALSELRPNDSGIYRCEVQHGIDDSSDAVEVKVKGVVFLYREGSARYAFSFARAQEACARVGARIATPEQLYAAYLGGYEQCDAGWLADQTVRYPIQTPREACYGDMDGFPGVRNYGVVDPADLYDVYCYAEDLNGELFLGAPPDKLTLEEARAYCRERGAEIATTGQLYAAWDGGLDRCSPGWLADGSVRYPIVTPSQRCGGGLPGVKTLFLFPNQTGFPNKYSRFNVYCFRDSGQPSATPEASNPASDGLEAIVTVTETLEELQLPREAVESESRGAIYSIPIMEDGGGGSSTPEDPAEAPRTLLGFETQSIVPPLGSSEEEDTALEEEEKYMDEDDKEEEEEVEVEDEGLWAWPSELSSPDPEAPLPTEPVLEESVSHAAPPPARAVLQPGASPPPDGEPETPRPPRVLGPPAETLPTPRNGKLASPPPSTPAGEREPHGPLRVPGNWRPPLKRILEELSQQGPQCGFSRCCPLTAPAKVEWPWPPHQVTVSPAPAAMVGHAWRRRRGSAACVCLAMGGTCVMLASVSAVRAGTPSRALATSTFPRGGAGRRPRRSAGRTARTWPASARRRSRTSSTADTASTSGSGSTTGPSKATSCGRTASPCSMRTGTPGSLTATSCPGRTAWSWCGTTRDNGVTCPATTTCPTPARWGWCPAGLRQRCPWLKCLAAHACAMK
uniref:Brevican core protein n=1 Tax=Suricata suricatta TaxID=37032 RepID=A0A673UH02_SURSU